MLSAFMNSPITITRYIAGAFNTTTGQYAAGTTSTITTTASVQPAPGRDLLLLPEGMRSKDVMKIYLREELKISDNDLKLNDKVTYKNRTYTVHTCSDWDLAGLPHYEGILVRDE